MGETIRYINENTGVPFKIVVPIVASIIGATVWLTAQLYEIRQNQRDAITRNEIAQWRNQFAERNKNLDVPYITIERK